MHSGQWHLLPADQTPSSKGQESASWMCPISQPASTSCIVVSSSTSQTPFTPSAHLQLLVHLLVLAGQDEHRRGVPRHQRPHLPTAAGRGRRRDGKDRTLVWHVGTDFGHALCLLGPREPASYA